jgi:hypothetical protein
MLADGSRFTDKQTPTVSQPGISATRKPRKPQKMRGVLSQEKNSLGRSQGH